jgi:4-amino-4-deoxy-L-arabinose transferase-like glycosyltransferase
VPLRSWLTRLLAIPYAAEIVAFLASVAYFLQTWSYAHTRESILDEGAYLLKGFAFATGQYQIYQDYGFWSNHMPFSFYIPGYVQLLFGPGLRTGRYLAIVLGMLGLLGAWLLVRRLRGKWWAAAAVWVIATNVAMIKMYSVMVTQVLIACLLVWMLVFGLGKSRQQWQIGIAAVLAGIALMTRINTLPVLPLLILYMLWQQGWRAALTTALAGGLVVMIGHALFWPEILRMWAYWLPESLVPFLSAWRPPTGSIPFWEPNIDLLGRLASFFMSFRVNFVAMVGALSTWLLWPRRKDWKHPSDRISAVFLSLVFLSLWLVHLWATLGKSYCVYCLPGYITFFEITGLVLVVISFPAWRKQLPIWLQSIIVVCILLISAGIGFGAFEELGNPLMDLAIPKFLLGLESSSESVRLGEFFKTAYQLQARELRRLFPALAGLGAGLAILGVAFLLNLWVNRRRDEDRISYGMIAQTTFLLTGLIFAPSLPLSGGYRFYECSGDVIASYEAAGKHLASLISPGSQVYWQGGLSTVPLLYLPGVKIYPPQVNGSYSFNLGTDSDELERYGFWNQELADAWVHQADYILIQQRYYRDWLKEVITRGPYQELQPTGLTAACRSDSQIRIFRRIP